MFLSYIAYETGGFVEVVENANYSKARLLQVFPQRFDEAKAEEYANKPEKVLNLVYANRLGNGSESSGDGWRYRGRGFLQFTGRDSYAQYSKETGLDLVENPDLMGDPNVSLLVAAIFWTKTGLNELADQDRFEDIAKKVSGAAIGLEPRKRLAALALKLLQDRNKTAAQ